MTSHIYQLDGNVTLDNIDTEVNPKLSKNARIADGLPVILVCNMRSLFPKIQNFKQDFLERGVDLALVSEIWEKQESVEHILEGYINSK